jgi:hypothetical protein
MEVAFGGKSNSFLFLLEGCMSRRLSLAFLSMVFFYGLSIAFAPRPALAVNCSLPVCIKECGRMGGGTQCSSWCDKTLAQRRSSGECKGNPPQR